tara:strand:+ start:64366 stop:64656 length:291 start_codon:yes stop_codon:yes gene_type:complete
MKKIIVQYKVKIGRAEENSDLIRAVFKELNSANPSGFQYTSSLLADGVTFVHQATLQDENPLNNMASFKNFTKDLKDRCEEPPVALEATQIGSFGI